MNYCKNDFTKICPCRTYCENYNCSPIEQENCDHKETYLSVLNATHTCETTALKCLHCGKLVTNPKTDCR